jgi:hypothetical protein
MQSHDDRRAGIRQVLEEVDAMHMDEIDRVSAKGGADGGAHLGTGKRTSGVIEPRTWRHDRQEGSKAL